MEEKICKKCGKLLPLDMFYPHKAMKDGHLNFCRDCVKTRVSDYRLKNIEKCREYDRTRSKDKSRIEKNTIRTKRRRSEVPGYASAHRKVDRAVANGDIQKSSICECCGIKNARIEGHHFDYAFPYDVIWLCSACHKQYHLGKNSVSQKVRSVVNKLVRDKFG